MAATKGNQWWKLRTKHGRDKLFETPEILMEACIEYLEATDKRKWNQIDFRGKDAKEVTVPIDTPYTLTGLFVYLNIDEKTWRNYKEREDFIRVITHVEQIITTQKVEGALVGVYSNNLVARLEGLKEQSESKHTIEGKTPIFGDAGIKE